MMRIIASDGFMQIKEDMFDLILLNPPQHAGKEVCFRLIRDSAHHLVKGGSLLLVARHTKGGLGYSSIMKEELGSVASVAKSGMFRVYRSDFC